MATTAKIYYNVGQITLTNGKVKNLFMGIADGQAFLCYKDDGKYYYMPYDAVMSAVSQNKAVLDSRVVVSAISNAASPAFSTQVTGSLMRTVAISNEGGLLVEDYQYQPYYSLRGDGIEEAKLRDPSAEGELYSMAGGSTETGGMNAVASVTGISIIDTAIAWVTENIILVAIAVGLFVYFDPLGWFKKKGSKKKTGK